jgi:hypothetical protein
MKINTSIDLKDIRIIVQGICCKSFNVGPLTPEELDFKLRIEKLKLLLEIDTLEKRFQFLSDNYPEHRQELNFMYWRHDHLYRNLVNGYFSKYTGINGN